MINYEDVRWREKNGVDATLIIGRWQSHSIWMVVHNKPSSIDIRIERHYEDNGYMLSKRLYEETEIRMPVDSAKQYAVKKLEEAIIVDQQER